MNETGTGGFTHLVDETGDLYEQFGTGGRSTFLYVNDDGTFEFVRYGVASEEDLRAQAERLRSS